MNLYDKPHTVILLFEQQGHGQLPTLNNDKLLVHRNYYKTLGEQAEMLHYGVVMNDNTLSIIIRVASQTIFEQVINKDPALQSGLLELKQVIPFEDEIIS